MRNASGTGLGRKEAALFVAAIVAVSALMVAATLPRSGPEPNALPQGLGSFTTYSQLEAFMAANAKSAQQYVRQGTWFMGPGLGIGAVKFENAGDFVAMTAAVPAATVPTFTGTNLQVQGVDEPDRVKTDGKLMFVSTGDSVSIINAYPPNSTAIVSTISLKGTSIIGLEMSDGRLLVIDQRSSSATYVDLLLYDTSTAASPRLIENFSIAGTYVAARMTQGFAYAVVQQPSYQFSNSGNATAVLPSVTENGAPSLLKPNEVHFAPNRAQINFYTMTVSMSMATGAQATTSVLTGPSSVVYASTTDIYIVYADYIDYYADGIPGDIFTGGMIPAAISQQGQNSTVVRASYSSGNVTVAASGTVPGTVLNQFSVDEYNGYFRMATSRLASVGGSGTRSDDVYVLNRNMTQVSVLRNIAPGENIYAVRFVGDTGYVVTFEQIDPLFVISFKDIARPTILSALKVSGYSDYLHPLPGGYLIGIGKDAVPSSTGDFAYYLGLKLSLFRIFDNGSSVQVSKYLVGDRGTDSPVLTDHLAFTFDSTKNITVIPVLLAKVSGNQSYGPDNIPPFGDDVWQGVYVFKVTTQGFQLLGTVSQYPQGQNFGDSPDYGLQVDRSVIIGNHLYTISQEEVMVTDLSSFSTVATVALPS